jgi:hypothetical protein
LGLHNVSIHRANFFDVTFEQDDILVCYLYPEAMSRLKAKLESESRHHVLISNTFALPDTQATKTLHLDDLYYTPIYYYDI